MRLREPFVRKHVHDWRLAKNQTETGRYGMQRQCKDCNAVQYGYITAGELEGIPQSLAHLADVPWYDGSLPAAFKVEFTATDFGWPLV